MDKIDISKDTRGKTKDRLVRKKDGMRDLIMDDGIRLIK